mmetsp:Transcript_10485/g.18363  ORF Transcript_10485/g.18363 Transcript_10485/m.18363 type:complete len:81 (+) Transcript_10485:780-1022(+)
MRPQVFCSPRKKTAAVWRTMFRKCPKDDEDQDGTTLDFYSLPPGYPGTFFEDGVPIGFLANSIRIPSLRSEDRRTEPLSW